MLSSAVPSNHRLLHQLQPSISLSSVGKAAHNKKLCLRRSRAFMVTRRFQYVVIKFLMSALSLCFLIPIGSLVVGWIGSILYTFTFRFLRARTGGYHAKTPHGCLITSVILQILFLSLSICMPDASLFIFVAIISGLSIALIGPVNHPELHLSSAEMSALRPRIYLRVAFILIAFALILFVNPVWAGCIAFSIFSVALLLAFSAYGFGVQ